MAFKSRRARSASDMALAACPGRHGLLCYEEEDRTIGASIATYGEWAEEELFFLSTFLDRGATVLDVGAHIGTHSLAFARFAGCEGRVVAIDAQERAYQLLVLNAALNGFPQVTCIRALVGKESGLRFVAPQDPRETDLGAVPFYNLSAASPDAPFLSPLPMITVDDMALPRCDLLKIDIEGMEFDALLGSIETIRRHLPVIYFEQTRAENFSATFGFLDEAGYQLFWHIADPFNRHNFRGQSANIFGGTRELNILAWPKVRGAYQWPEHIALQPISGPAYDPPPRQGSLEGWPMPADAYAHLPPVTTQRLSSMLGSIA